MLVKKWYSSFGQSALQGLWEKRAVRTDTDPWVEQTVQTLWVFISDQKRALESAGVSYPFRTVQGIDFLWSKVIAIINYE